MGAIVKQAGDALHRSNEPNGLWIIEEISLMLLSGACFIAFASIVIAGMITNASIAEGEAFCQVFCNIT